MTGNSVYMAFAVGLFSACSVELIEVDPSEFACDDDQPIQDDLLPCGPTHWCVEGQCAPRLGCIEPDRDFPGCERAADTGRALRRCEPVFRSELSAVQCEGGTHTSTSVRPPDGQACTCPDGLHCVAFLQGGSDDAPDLRLLPTGGAASGPEVPDRRLCVRACSEEDNCSADHTCRPALVESAALSTPRGGERNTVAVCYPNVIVGTSSTSTVAEPVAGACRRTEDCPQTDEECTYEVTPIPDHPVHPIGAPWDGHLALVGRCLSRSQLSGRRQTGGCLAGTDCLSGLCIGGFCALPCAPAAGCGTRNCVVRLAERSVGPDQPPVLDRVHVCERL